MAIQKKKKKSRLAFLSSGYFIGFVLIALILVSSSVVKEVYRRHMINKEIAELKREIEEMEDENKNLGGLISYLKSEDYKEKEAKAKLDLKKPGEDVVIIPPKAKSDTTSSEYQIEKEKEKVEDTRKNPEKWWQYFFGVQKNNK
ncbi:hypothetical protein COY23_01890 [bacterium (Candidatus Torokbacteria) CG_4_10_14_0_2_um_filter_35_8]|nr:MAG: hypothetical protein COY23_01890 [bacterium (Candidatus Torokbacteria) CG_4_10_14_0_2_um_filter_35_8]